MDTNLLDDFSKHMGESKDYFDKLGDMLVISTDDECRDVLFEVKNNLKLNEGELVIINNCISVTNAKEGEIVNYGPDEIIGLLSMIKKYDNYSLKLNMCKDFLDSMYEAVADDPEIMDHSKFLDMIKDIENDNVYKFLVHTKSN